MILGIDFQLLAKFEQTLVSPDDFLRELKSWVYDYAADLAPSARIGFSEDRPTLFCHLHPAAEELELSLLDLDHLVASARTSTVGPGYHIFVCDMVRKLGERFGLAWVTDNEEYFDEAGYFFSGNQKAVFDEMASWLRGLCGCFFNDNVFAEEAEDMPTMLCLRIGEAFEADSRAVTPLGPRDLEWLKSVSRGGSLGHDFFAWWKPGLTAEYFVGRALCRMWTDVRWRKPVNGQERETLNYVAGSLETAFKLDPALDYPWAEWAQILDLLEKDDADTAFVRSHHHGRPEIGYRRRNVAVTLPGYWVVKVPGSFSDFEADEEGDFSAQDPPRTIWFTSYKFEKNRDELSAKTRHEILSKPPALLEERKGYLARAEINKKGTEENEPYFVLSSSNVCRKGRSILSVVFTDPEDSAWAEAVWRSLQPPGEA